MSLPLDQEIQEDVSLPEGSLLRLYYPLALSWIFMSVEMPVAVAIISRLPGGEVAAAGLLVMMGLALWVESPIIDLLATSTTLASNAKRYGAIRRFSLWLIVGVTVVHGAIALTPVYDFITRNVMAVPAPVAASAKIGFIIMIPWSGLIGWRRFLQGLLIRGGDTRAIGIGTFVRVFLICAVGFFLKAVTSLPSLQIVAIALILSVAAECIYIHFAARPFVVRVEKTWNDEQNLTTAKLISFHTPLTLSTMITMIAMPVLAAALAHAANPTQSMAAWQVAASVMFLFRSVTFALTEVVIARYRSPSESRRLFAFCASVGALSSALVLVLSAAGVSNSIFAKVLGAKPEIATLAVLAFVSTAAVPFLNAMCSYNKGVLTQQSKTVARLTAIAFAFIATAIVLIVGLRLRWSGVVIGAAATTAGQAAELAILAMAWSSHRRKSWPRRDQSLAQNIAPAGSAITEALNTSSALRSPSIEDMSPSSCSIESTES